MQSPIIPVLVGPFIDLLDMEDEIDKCHCDAIYDNRNEDCGLAMRFGDDFGKETTE